MCWFFFFHIPIKFILQALSGLHEQIPPFPRTDAMRIIEEELGSPVESLFSYISEEPVAAASFGQVIPPFVKRSAMLDLK